MSVTQLFRACIAVLLAPMMTLLNWSPSGTGPTTSRAAEPAASLCTPTVPCVTLPGVLPPLDAFDPPTPDALLPFLVSGSLPPRMGAYALVRRSCECLNTGTQIGVFGAYACATVTVNVPLSYTPGRCQNASCEAAPIDCTFTFSYSFDTCTGCTYQYSGTVDGNPFPPVTLTPNEDGYIDLVSNGNPLQCGHSAHADVTESCSSGTTTLLLIDLKCIKC